MSRKATHDSTAIENTFTNPYVKRVPESIPTARGLHNKWNIPGKDMKGTQDVGCYSTCTQGMLHIPLSRSCSHYAGSMSKKLKIFLSSFTLIFAECCPSILKWQQCTASHQSRLLKSIVLIWQQKYLPTTQTQKDGHTNWMEESPGCIFFASRRWGREPRVWKRSFLVLYERGCRPWLHQ